MIEQSEILGMPEYWFQEAQLDFYNQVKNYMKKEKINNVQLAGRLGVGKSYVTQILNGEYNYSLKKLIDICLAIGIVPKINYTPLEAVIKEDAEKKTEVVIELALPLSNEFNQWNLKHGFPLVDNEEISSKNMKFLYSTFDNISMQTITSDNLQIQVAS